jgi:hypothetical protein
MGIFRRTGSAKSAAARQKAGAAEKTAPVVTAVTAVPVLDVVEPQLNGGSIDESDVFVCRRSSPDLTPLPLPAEEIPEAAPTVTLFVFGWHHVEPGPLSWVFPSLRAALDAVRTMRNAAQWCIVSGDTWDSLDIARAAGAVLIEQLG